MNGRIVYRLEGQGVGEFFQNDELNGEIVVLRLLHRDLPSGIPWGKHILHSMDNGAQGSVGYADVQVNVKDVNDNPHRLRSDIYGSVKKNRVPGRGGGGMGPGSEIAEYSGR